MRKVYPGEILHEIGHLFEGPGPSHRPWHSTGDSPGKAVYEKRKGRYKDVKIVILYSRNRLIIECQLKIISNEETKQRNR